MTQTLPPLITEAVALSVSEAGLLRYEMGPGLLATVSCDKNEAVVSFVALHCGILAPLLEHGFRWLHFDG